MKKRGKLNKRLLIVRGEVEKNRIRTDIEEIENKIRESHKQEIWKNEAEAVEAIKDNVKYFYQYAKQKSIVRTSIGPLEVGNELTSDPVVIIIIIRVKG